MSNGLKIQVEAHIKKYNTEVYTIIFKKYEINKSELFRSFVHELRNPMNSLCQSNEIIELDLERLKKNNELLYLQLYEKTSFESTYKNQITAVCFIKNLLNDFLDFEKLQANTFVINQDEQCSISQIIDEVKNLITPFLFFEEKTIHYNCNNICDAKITIDKTRMCQIILNLLQNAIKYSIGNEIFLEINIISDKIVCSISHQGNIENSHIPNIFDPFYRVNISKNDGTGLGLFICKNIIDKMKGTISFLSDNCNIIAKFSIPVIIYNSCIENNTILIVDDFIGIRSTKTLLEIKGFKVDVVRSGEECIKKCKNTKYDIILMDKNMNGLSGIETVKILRESGYNGIIYGLTGDCLASVSESFDCSSNGVNNVIYKPLDINNLISMFQKDYINVLTQHK